MDKEQLYSNIRRILVEQFDVKEESISMDANLYEELQIDSIDAVDLLVQLKELTGEKVSPETFKDVRTIRDVINALTNLWIIRYLYAFFSSPASLLTLS